MAPLGIRDVAARAGVSPATVSRVLNGSVNVREESVARVQAAVAELGYRPNRLAGNLRRRSAAMVGVVVSDIENPHFTAMVRTVEDAAYGQGYRMLLCNVDEDADKQRAYLEMLADERARGVILSPSNPTGAEITEVLDLGIPVVAFDRRVADPRADSVVAANQHAARRATERLLAAGHQQIALLGGRPGTETAVERQAGYLEAMEAAGGTPLVADGGFRIEPATTAVTELLAEHPKLSALVVANNLMAVGALAALAAAGKTVPDDMALIAIDDPFWAGLVKPPLTVLAQPVRAMAEGAMRLLSERIEGAREEPRHDVFDCELIVRGSCGTKSESER